MWTPDVVGPINSPVAGYGVITTPDAFAATPAAAPYQVQPPLEQVWAGDDEDNPQNTVQLRFPDEATAQQVLAAYWTPDESDTPGA